MAEQGLAPSVEIVVSPTAGDNESLHRLVGQLTRREYTIEEVTENVQRAVESPVTTIGVRRDPESGHIMAMATLNMGRTHRGIDAWIDDVCTDTGFRNQGHFGILMGWAESFAHQGGARQVQLTSGIERQDARRRYERRGYKLVPEKIYRKDTALGQLAIPANVEPLDDITMRDTVGIAELLGRELGAVRADMVAAQASVTSQLYVARGTNGAITGVGTATAYPIPVCYKTWAHIDAASSEDTAGLLVAMEHDLPPEVTAVNTTFRPPVEAGDYALRPSGLFVLPLTVVRPRIEFF